MIPAEAIAEVKARHELVTFIEGAGVALRRHGESYLGLCPLHQDHQPSLSVSPKKQSWCCLGACSVPGKVAGGDVIEFARRLWNVSFPEALRRLGATTTMTLPPTSHTSGRRLTPPLRVVSSQAPRPPAQSSASLLGQVAALYHQGFVSSCEAKAYAASRGLTNPDLLSALPMGFSDGSLLERAPEGSRTYAALKAHGVISRNGRELFERCLVVPLYDLLGNVVSFYGRAIDRKQHLYLPGPRRGLVNAQCAATSDEIILTESVFDALSFIQAAIPNAVPLYGANGFTQDHEALLEKRRIRRVTLALDSDETGRGAARAIAEKLRARGIEVLDIDLARANHALDVVIA